MQPPLRGLWFRGPSPHVNSLTMRKASSAPGRALPLLFPPGDVSTSVNAWESSLLDWIPWRNRGLEEGRPKALGSI